MANRTHTHCFEAPVVNACKVQRVGTEMTVARQVSNHTCVLVEDVQELHGARAEHGVKQNPQRQSTIAEDILV